MNLELIKLSKERINKANLELTEYSIKESSQSANYKHTQELINKLESNIASEYTDELDVLLSRLAPYHQDHGECRVEVRGRYYQEDETVNIRVYIVPIKFNLDKTAYKGLCAEWNKAEEEGNENYLSHEIVYLPSALPDSPLTEFELTIKAGEPINYKEYFAALAKALYGRKIYLLPE